MDYGFYGFHCTAKWWKISQPPTVETVSDVKHVSQAAWVLEPRLRTQPFTRRL